MIERDQRLRPEAQRVFSRKHAIKLAIAIPLIALAIGIASSAFLLHVNLSTAGSIEMLLVLFVALRLGFFPATAVSVCAFLCLNFFFTDPIFTFAVADPQNWVSLFTFEATALLVSGLSSKVRKHSVLIEEQRKRAVKLYELSRAILLIDQRQPANQQLSALIREFLEVDQVDIWVYAGSPEISFTTTQNRVDEKANIFCRQDEDYDHLGSRVSQRLLRLGSTAIGTLKMSGWEVDPLTADAVASLSAITLERIRAIERENRAEIERDAERLRTAVLDGLAHGFKTPLTAIRTASSGLLAIDQLNSTQSELVSLIDERAMMLTQLTTRLLQTAALESREMRLRRTSVSIVDLLHKLLREQEGETRDRTKIQAPDHPRSDQLDAPLVELALQQLLDNAAKYSAIDSPIEITVAQTTSETRIMFQNIATSGSSIRPEERARIFERFYRGGDAASGPAGTGLGLSIVKKTAEAHGGSVSVETSDQSTRFIFSLQHYHKEKNG